MICKAAALKSMRDGVLWSGIEITTTPEDCRVRIGGDSVRSAENGLQGADCVFARWEWRVMMVRGIDRGKEDSK